MALLSCQQLSIVFGISLQTWIIWVSLVLWGYWLVLWLHYEVKLFFYGLCWSANQVMDEVLIMKVGLCWVWHLLYDGAMSAAKSFGSQYHVKLGDQVGQLDYGLQWCCWRSVLQCWVIRKWLLVIFDFGLCVFSFFGLLVINLVISCNGPLWSILWDPLRLINRWSLSN